MGRQNGNGNAATLPARQDFNQPPARQATPQREFQSLINGSKERLADVLPKYLTPERIIRVSLAAYNRKSEIQKCDPLSILNSIILAAQFGFEVDSPLQHAYLIPYKGMCTLQIGYRGFIDLARRSQEYRAIEAVEVFEGDGFEFFRDPQPRVRHTPSLADDPGKMTHVYAYAITKGGEPVVEFMSRGQVEVIRRASKMPDSLMWKSYFGEGAKKTALKRMLKRQPMTIEMADAITLDNESEGDARIGNGQSSAPQLRGTAGLKAQLAGPEPEFTTDQGVERPVYSEAEPETAPADPDPDDLAGLESEGRETGED
jgi:recombination protein RecT